MDKKDLLPAFAVGIMFAFGGYILGGVGNEVLSIGTIDANIGGALGFASGFVTELFK